MRLVIWEVLQRSSVTWSNLMVVLECDALEIPSRKNKLLQLGLHVNQRRSTSIFRTCLALDVSCSLFDGSLEQIS